MELTLRAFEHWLFQYRRVWRGTVISGFVLPFMTLAGMGLGLGSFIDDRAGPDALGGASYLAFIAPGLLAATAMMAAAFESTYPVLGSIKWDRVYYAMLATPLRARDVALGHLSWVGARLFVVSAFYLLVIALFGAVESWWGVLAIPAATLTGLAFAAPIFAFSASVERDSGFALIFRFVVTPMFLFSGTFFPVSQLPLLLEYVAYVTPLWHGVELCRGMTLGEIGFTAAVGHTAYLGLWVVVGGWLALRAFRRRLVV